MVIIGLGGEVERGWEVKVFGKLKAGYSIHQNNISSCVFIEALSQKEPQ